MASKTEQQVIQAKALEALRELGGKTFHADEDVVFEGSRLVLPVGSSVDTVIKTLVSYKEEQDAKVAFNRRFSYRPWDVAYVGVKALREHFGMVSHKGGFLSPPALIDVPVGVNETVQVPWGKFQIPALPEVTFTFSGDYDPELGTIGIIGAQGPKKQSFEIQGVFNLVEDALKRESIYRGKAIDGQEMPNFIDVESLDERQIVYSTEVLKDLEANLFEPLARRETTQAEGLPLKRAILLEGPFGTGKTLALKWAGKIATAAEKPWTFLLVRPGRDNIEEAMKTARIYGPTIIAFEDVDTVANAEQESSRISKMLDLFDGMDAKGQDVMVVLTTNHVELLHAGMLRPGRLDAIIKIGAPDAEGIRKLVQANMPANRLAEEIDWPLVGQAMDGYLPAFVVEAAQRSIRYQLSRLKGKLNGEKIETEDLVYAASGLRAQWELMNQAETGHTPPDLDTAVKRIVQLAIEGKLDSRLLVEDE